MRASRSWGRFRRGRSPASPYAAGAACAAASRVTWVRASSPKGCRRASPPGCLAPTRRHRQIDRAARAQVFARPFPICQQNEMGVDHVRAGGRFNPSRSEHRERRSARRSAWRGATGPQWWFNATHAFSAPSNEALTDPGRAAERKRTRKISSICAGIFQARET